MASAFMSIATTRRRPESERAQSEHAAAAADVEDPLPTSDPLQQLLDEQPRRGMLATSEAPGAELDQPRQVSAVVLGPHEAHAEPLPERDRAGVAHPRFEARRRRRVESTADRPSARSAEARRPASPSSSTAASTNRRASLGCHDLHRAHATLAEAGPHARDLVLGGRDDDDHRARLPQHPIDGRRRQNAVALLVVGPRRAVGRKRSMSVFTDVRVLDFSTTAPPRWRPCIWAISAPR